MIFLEEYRGLLEKTILLQEKPIMMSLLIMSDGENKTEVLIKDRYLSSYVFRLPDNKYMIHIAGRRNKRNQLVAKHFEIMNPDEYIKIIGAPE
ncbi:hypothetical protein P7H59_01060 [Enterococcus viikkiensis]|uniref:Uncharacterized protein n=1 Tax=Enterococcus viikkiensis TaxID=930854 RepID=A0ABU3FNZ3_9ENTE|nr:hypothetical protein [Enterococcus viikkiensis]